MILPTKAPTVSWVILCTVATNEEAKIFCEHIIRDLDISLIYMSMCCYKYDALLKIDIKKQFYLILKRYINQ